MSDTSAPTSGSETNGALPGPPLFYQQPEPVFPGAHADFKIRPERDFSFAAGSNTVPVTVLEFPFVARHYPIVFLGPELVPAAAVGFSQDTNHFVNRKGEWDKDVYIPAYVRRYPFILLGKEGDDKLHLGVDGAGRSSKPEARPLFKDGKETEMLTQNLQFCEQFHGSFLQTQEFSKALVAAGIVEEGGIEITSPTGEARRSGGFARVSEEKFRNLPDATIIEWHKRGFLHSVYFHLQSLNNWEIVMQRFDTKSAA